ncbi:MAG: undecaprenyl-phosphate glucose phosphotransferase, partial [Flavobacteriaceae bacterium]|nr:undecaprenyl-phosphate glucose phosphotransferase [Flavobacteriaceae bacterium]
MSLFKQGRYSGYLRPISYAIDLILVNGLAIFYFFKDIDPLIFLLIISSAWVILSLSSNFYEVYRYTREVTIFSLILKQMVLFTLIIFAFAGFYREFDVYPKTVAKYILLLFFLIAVMKFAIYYTLQKYRTS